VNVHKLQAIFFDFDGVILDSTHIKTEAFKRMFEPFGDNIVNKVLEHHLNHGGISRVEKIAHYYDTFLNSPLSREELEHSCLQFSNRVKDLVVNAAWIPGMKEFLQSYHTKADFYVVSGTPEDELKEIIERRTMTGFFKRIMGSPIKKPIHVNLVLESERLKPEYCIFVGDALTNYYTALETGVHFIGIQGEVYFPPGTTVLPDGINLRTAIEQI